MLHNSRIEAHKFYAESLKDKHPLDQKAILAALGRNDLFFLLVRILNRPDCDHDWLYDRCMEVQQKPNGYLDLWAREHYKSTIITFALTIQDILNDPEITIGLFSINRPNAKKFLGQIRHELMSNVTLKELYPEVLYENPTREAPKWSLDDGIIVKRKSNPKEATIEAHGLVDSMPTGRHFKIRLYDDVIDDKHVTNPEMIQKSLQSWELSLNLGSTQVSARYGIADIERYAGTRYHYNDPYNEIMKRGAAKQRIYPGTVDGKPNGKPVMWTKEIMAKKRRTMGSYIFGCQILQNPIADAAQGFKKEHLFFWETNNTRNLNTYIIVDPASSKKKGSDYTSMWVIGQGSDKNYYVIDGIRDRLDLVERAKQLFDFHATYNPVAVGYEQYGMQADIEHMQDKMNRENYRFAITPLGGKVAKEDRIRTLYPLFEAGRIYLPKKLNKVNYEGKVEDLIQIFINDEYMAFPVALHDDMLDCLARITDKDLSIRPPRNLKRNKSNTYMRGMGGRKQKKSVYRRGTGGRMVA